MSTVTRGSAAGRSLLQPLRLRTAVLLGAAFWFVFLCLWYGASLSGLVPSILLPRPDEVVSAFFELFSRGFASDILASIQRIAVSFTITAAIALPLGLAMGVFRSVGALVDPFTATWRYLPAVSFVPLLLMWLGTGEPPKLALLILGVVFFLVTIVADETRKMPRELLEAGLTLGLSRKALFFRIVLPWMLPNLLIACRQTIAIGWTYLVIAEIIASTNGIGAMMMRAQRFVNTDQIMAGIVTIGVLGLLTDRFFVFLERFLFPYRRAGR